MSVQHEYKITILEVLHDEYTVKEVPDHMSANEVLDETDADVAWRVFDRTLYVFAADTADVLTTLHEQGFTTRWDHSPNSAIKVELEDEYCEMCREQFAAGMSPYCRKCATLKQR